MPKASLVAALTFAASFNLNAQTFPTRPINIVVPYAPGGTNDILARTIANKMSSNIGQTVLVTNRPGAGGNIGAQYVANSPPDGYTLLIASSGVFAINKWLYSKLGYDPDSFAPIVLAGSVPNVLLVSPSVPAKDVPSLIAYARANPNKLNFASMGSGTSGHLSAELFKMQAGVEIQHVPYKGSSAALTDLLGGQVQLMFDNLPTALPHVRSGKLKAFAVSSLERTPLLPDVPTVDEAGVKGFDATAWFGVAAPAGTPRAIVEKLNREMVQAMTDPGVKETLSAQGVSFSPNSATEFAAFIAAESPKWKRVVEASGARAD